MRSDIYTKEHSQHHNSRCLTLDFHAKTQTRTIKTVRLFQKSATLLQTITSAPPPTKGNLPRAQDNDFKIAVMNMFKDVKEDMNKSLMKTVKTQTVE